MTGLCAICANDGEGAMQVLDGREVFVCDRCENEHPIYGGYDAGRLGRTAPHALTKGGSDVGCRWTSAGGGRRG